MTEVAVVGLGLIGGSIALGLKARGWDDDRATRDFARGRGISTAASLEEAVTGAGLIFTAVPTAGTPAVLRAVAEFVPTAVLTDAASLKVSVLRASLSLPPQVRFVGGHPMAGSAVPGLAGAAADLFAGRPWLIVPGTRSDAAAVALVIEEVVRLGADPVMLEAEEHDAAMTWISHLPLAVSAALARVVVEKLGMKSGSLAGPGLLDTTRLAGARRELALELCLSDPGRLAAALQSVSQDLAVMADGLKKDDHTAIEEFLKGAARARQTIRKR